MGRKYRLIETQSFENLFFYKEQTGIGIIRGYWGFQIKKLGGKKQFFDVRREDCKDVYLVFRVEQYDDNQEEVIEQGVWESRGLRIILIVGECYRLEYQFFSLDSKDNYCFV